MIKSVKMVFNKLEDVLEVDSSLGEISFKYNLGDVKIYGENGEEIISENVTVNSENPLPELPLDSNESSINLLKLLVIKMLKSKYNFFVTQESPFIEISEEDNERYLDIVGRLNRITVPDTIVRDYLNTLYKEITKIDPDTASKTTTQKVFHKEKDLIFINVSCKDEDHSVSMGTLHMLSENENNPVTNCIIQPLRVFDLNLIRHDIYKVFDIEKALSYKFDEKPIIEFINNTINKIMNCSYIKRNIISDLPKDTFNTQTIGTLLFELKDNKLHLVTETDSLYGKDYFKAPIKLKINENDFGITDLSIPTVAMGLPTMIYDVEYNNDQYKIVFKTGTIDMLKELCTEEFIDVYNRLTLLETFKEKLLSEDGRDMITDGFLSVALKYGWTQDSDIKQPSVTFLPIKNSEDLHILIKYLLVDWDTNKQEKIEKELLVEKGMVFKKVNDKLQFNSVERVHMNYLTFFGRIERLSELYKTITKTSPYEKLLIEL